MFYTILTFYVKGKGNWVIKVPEHENNNIHIRKGPLKGLDGRGNLPR